MTQTEILTELADKRFLDLDLTDNGSWVGITENEVIIDYVPIPIDFKFDIPKIRSLGFQRVLIWNPRTEPHTHNAVILGINQEPMTFFADDAIEDVIITKDFIVFTYFDEGHSSSEMGGQGAAIFDKKGNYLYGVRDTFGLDFIDCHCACSVRPNTVTLFAYPGFNLDIIDLTKKEHKSITVPEKFHAATAISEYRGDFLFSLFDGVESKIFLWSPRSEKTTIIGLIADKAKSLFAGRFYTVQENKIVVYEP